MTLTPERIAELQALAEAATPGPWAHDDDGSFMGCGQVYTMGEGVEGGNIAGPSGDCYPRSGYSPAEDMQFIAAWNPETAKAVLDLLAEKDVEIERLRKAMLNVPPKIATAMGDEVALLRRELDSLRTLHTDKIIAYDAMKAERDTALAKVAAVEAILADLPAAIRARRQEFRRLGAHDQYLMALDDAFGLASNAARAALATGGDS